jgi:hypothetical protein
MNIPLRHFQVSIFILFFSEAVQCLMMLEHKAAIRILKVFGILRMKHDWQVFRRRQT